MFGHDTMTEPQHEGHSDDSGYTASPASPSQFTDFEVLELKPKPCPMDDTLTENLLEESSTSHIPVPAPEMKFPVVVLEKCDKIWETLQLIKTVQNKSPKVENNHYNEEEKEKVPHSNEIGQAASCVKSQSTSKDDKIIPVPFQFLVQRTKKLYPCITCGKQYLERRSLRKHSERVHGIIIPLQRKRSSNLKPTDKMDFNKNDSVVSLNEENNYSEQIYNRDSYGTTAEFETAKHPTTNPLKKSRNMTPEINSIDGQFKNIETDSSSAAKTEFAKCVLCGVKVKSVKKHLVRYHKIGCSSSMMKQLESSLLIKNGISSGDKKVMLENVLSDKPPQISTNRNTQDKLCIMDGESKAQETSQVRKKRKYTFSYVNAKKKLKLNTERCMTIQNAPSITQKYTTLNDTSYKCDICLGIYSSSNSFAKHKRIHTARGETKENFHNFKCRYFNSPLNKKYQLSRSSVKSTDAATKDISSNILLNQNGRTSRISRAAACNGKMKTSNDTTCICGRSFRNPHYLFVHKNTCKLCNQEVRMIQHAARDKFNNDKDSKNGINITIKKRNNSYEIVGKDSDEDKPKKPDNSKDGISTPKVFDDFTKDSTDASAKHQQLDTAMPSEYSKDHSILKLQDADEDLIIDIEDDIQIISDKDDEIQPTVTQEDSQKQQNDVENNRNEKSYGEVRMLKQMCQDVLDELAATRKSKNTMICQENKRNLRSSNKNYQNIRKEYNYSYDETEDCKTKLDLLSTCGYCNKQFDTISLYNKHQCTVKEGKEFDDCALHLLCFCCNEILSNCNEFDEHMRVKHFDRAYYCYQCPSRFLSDRERKRHFRAEHNNASCRFCNKKLAISMKILHEGYHLGFGYPCHKCKKAYSHKKKLSYHNSTIHKNGSDNTILCNICLKPVKLKTFRRHMYAHNHNECHFCGKIFANRTGMEYHTLIYHRGTSSRLKSNVSAARFLTKKQLERHEKIDEFMK